jgi:ABC-2 type transport system ATP-binding protein
MSLLAIDASNIKQSFNEVTALNNVNLSIPAGSVFGLLGPNGAGKTTIVRVLNGLITPTSAKKISILGLDINVDIQNIRQRVGVLTDTNLYDRLTAIENLVFFGDLYGLSKTDSNKRATEILTRFELIERANSKVETFSKGMKQKVSIARALMADPELVYLDEPTAGLDPEASYELLQYIHDVSSNSEKTFFITSHRLEEMESICDSVAILNKGVIQAIGAPKELGRQVCKDYWVSVELDGGSELDITVLGKELPFIHDARHDNGVVRIKIESRNNIPKLIKHLGNTDIDIYGISEDVPTLQDAYLALVKEEK